MADDEVLCPECGHPGPHIPLGGGLFECGDPECGQDCGVTFEVSGLSRN